MAKKKRPKLQTKPEEAPKPEVDLGRATTDMKIAGAILLNGYVPIRIIVGRQFPNPHHEALRELKHPGVGEDVWCMGMTIDEQGFLVVETEEATSRLKSLLKASPGTFHVLLAAPAKTPLIDPDDAGPSAVVKPREGAAEAVEDAAAQAEPEPVALPIPTTPRTGEAFNVAGPKTIEGERFAEGEVVQQG